MEINARMLRMILGWIELSPGSGIHTERVANRLGVEDSVASTHVSYLFDQGWVLGSEMDGSTCMRRHTITCLTPKGRDELARLRLGETPRQPT